MKLTDIVANILAENNIKHVFAVSGGASLHLIHSLAKNPNTTYICPQHEQGGAYAADGYARASSGLGCAIATSGPGATNLITGIASSYYDSVPVIYITGQVATFRSKGNTGVRQMGFQETDIVDICKTITKYAVLVQDPFMIEFELNKAIQIAQEGRPGPVLVDIPDDLQRMDIDPSKLVKYLPSNAQIENKENSLDEVINNCIDEIKNSTRPIIIYGWGIHLAGAENEALELAKKTGIPVAMTWGARDLMPEEDELTVGGFGTHGTRCSNYAVQNSDLVICVGSRLDTKATGTPPSSFAREAKIIMVDIDPCEINKFGVLNRKIDIGVVEDAKIFLKALCGKVSEIDSSRYNSWLERIHGWKKKYPQVGVGCETEKDINPYWLIKKLSELLDEDQIIFSDTGCSIAWSMQAFEFKKGQKFFHAFNNTPMGYALPGAIGASFAKQHAQIICIVGDGALLMSIQELATVAHHNLPIKILLMNNDGHAMVRQTQEMWLDGDFFATSPEGGLPSPNFESIASAFGFECSSVNTNQDIERKLRWLLNANGPTLLNVVLSPDVQVEPQVKFGRPNEDANPLLNRDEFFENMIIKPLDVSRSI